MSTDVNKGAEVVPTDSSVGPVDSRSPLVQWIQIAVLTLLIGCTFLGIGWWRSGGMATSWAYLQGERLIFTPANIIIENAKPGDTVERTIVVKNLSSKTVTLIGSQESCGCITLNDFPIKIKPHSQFDLRLKIGIPNKAEGFDNFVKVFTDMEGMLSVEINITGNLK